MHFATVSCVCIGGYGKKCDFAFGMSISPHVWDVFKDLHLFFFTCAVSSFEKT